MHGGDDWTLLASPAIPIVEQKKLWRELLGSRVHDDYSEATYQESDGHLIRIRFNSPTQQAEFDKTRKAEAAAQVKQDNVRKPDAVKDALSRADYRRKRQDDENKAFEAKRKEAEEKRAADQLGAKDVDSDTDAKPESKPENPESDPDYVPALDKDGNRLDGPTLDEWIKAGYKKNKYPPKGYAPKPDEQPSGKSGKVK